MWFHSEYMYKVVTHVSLNSFNVIKCSLKEFEKNIQQNAIKYLTYLVLNKRKLDNKQTPIPHLHRIGKLLTPHPSPPPKEAIHLKLHHV
jgi:hypothetical protein